MNKEPLLWGIFAMSLISGLLLGIFIETRTDVYPENMITTITGRFIQQTIPSVSNFWLGIVSLVIVLFDMVLIALRPSGIVVGSLSIVGALVLFYSPSSGVVIIIVSAIVALFYPEIKD